MVDAGSLGLLFRDCVVSNQATRTPDLVHDLVAGIDAERALNAFELQTVTNIDAHRANRHAGLAIDAVAAPLPALAFAQWPARLAPVGSVADEQRMAIDHRALDARPRAHVNAD